MPSVLVAGLVTTIAVTFWYSWLFNHTAGSVLLVVMAHSVPLGGHRTLGWAAAPTAAAEEGRRRTLKAIHAPLITTNAAPTSAVGGVLAGPIVDAYTRLEYISTWAWLFGEPMFAQLLHV